MITAVVFDVDGVLVEDMVFARILVERYGIGRELTEEFFQGPFKQCILGRADLKQSLSPYLDAWQWPGSLDDFLRTWFEADSGTNKEMLGFATDLRKAGIRCYVASTQEAYRAAYLENDVGLGDLFDGLFFSCRLGHQKPDRSFFELVSSQTGTGPGNLLFLDDHTPNVEGARAAGWNAELYRFGDDITTLANKYGLSGA